MASETKPKPSLPLFLSSLILLICISSNTCNGASILFYNGGHSHRVGIQPLALELFARGHQITFLAPQAIPAPHPNIIVFSPKDLTAFSQEMLNQAGDQRLETRIRTKFANEVLKGTELLNVSYKSCESVFKSPDFKPWVIQQNRFDLIVIDGYANECAFALVYYFKAKSIVFSSISGLMPWDPDMFGLPTESSWLPTMSNNYEGQMCFCRRFINTMSTFYWGLKYQRHHLPKLDSLVRDPAYLGGALLRDMPSLLEMIKKVDLMFLNQHYSDQFARSLPPFVIPVGGMHLQQSHKSLPDDLEEFIEGAGEDGFIYISFGASVKMSIVSPEIFHMFLDAIGKCKQRFLWNWEDESAVGIPNNASKNIYFKHWFPQQDVLAHPKIKGFIMQGGQLSIQEAICNAVPLIIFPISGDQDISAKRVRHVRNGIEMEFYNLTVAYLEETINELVNDPSYSRNAKEMAKVCNDRIMSPLDTAVWWTEYVLRTEDTSHLKPLSIHQSSLIYRSLDVIAVIFLLPLIGLLVILGLVLCLRCMFKSFQRSCHKSEPESTTKPKQS